jgi:prefoldin alpha subunit
MQKEIPQELLFRASMIERQMQELQQNINFLESEINELNLFHKNISSFKNLNKTESFSSLGKGIHVKTTLSSKDLFVEVGSGVLVKKTAEETQEIIENQLKKMNETKNHFLQRFQDNHQELAKIVEEIESKK